MIQLGHYHIFVINPQTFPPYFDINCPIYCPIYLTHCVLFLGKVVSFDYWYQYAIGPRAAYFPVSLEQGHHIPFPGIA